MLTGDLLSLAVVTDSEWLPSKGPCSSNTGAARTRRFKFVDCRRAQAGGKLAKLNSRGRGGRGRGPRRPRPRRGRVGPGDGPPGRQWVLSDTVTASAFSGPPPASGPAL
jgi:hypothetical protein